MIINSGNLRTLFTGFKTSFQSGLGQAPSQHPVVAMRVNSTTREEDYGWLGAFPNVREWIGDRVINNLKTHSYSIKNRTFEATVAVDRDDIKDDNLGLYGPMFEEMGRSTAAFDDQLVWPMLKDGWNRACYDGQNFFDTDHPVLDADGNTISVSNSGGGSGTPWFLVDDSRALKPIILQVREDFNFVAKDDPRDDNVFMQRKYIYGVDGRRNAGYGLWQLAYGSKQTLNATNYATARAALMGMKGDYDRPLGLNPRKLIVPPSLEGAARKIVANVLASGGETNEWAGTAEVVVVPWLA